MFSPLIDELIAALRVLPGVGPKSAQRMAFHLLERNRNGAVTLAQALQLAVTKVARCQQCRTLTEQTLCRICANSRRETGLLCVVENPADVLALEQAGSFDGHYFVLHGHLSPIDGIGPAELGMMELRQRLQQGVKEMIIATGSTMEGEATAHYLSERARELGIKASRIAHGIPMGGELEYIDGNTLAHALASRREL